MEFHGVCDDDGDDLMAMGEMFECGFVIWADEVTDDEKEAFSFHQSDSFCEYIVEAVGAGFWVELQGFDDESDDIIFAFELRDKFHAGFIEHEESDFIVILEGGKGDNGHGFDGGFSFCHAGGAKSHGF